MSLISACGSCGTSLFLYQMIAVVHSPQLSSWSIEHLACFIAHLTFILMICSTLTTYCNTSRYVLVSAMKSILHFGLMRLEDLTEEDNQDNHPSHEIGGTSIITVLRYSSHLVFVTGIAVMSAKFWTIIYYVSGMT